MERVQPLELLDRARMVVDAQVDDRVARSAVATVLADDEERGRLLSAPVASRCLGGVEAGEQPLRERPAGRPFERPRERVHGLARDEDVALGRESGARRPPGPLEALGARERRRSPLPVDDPELPVVAPVVGADEPRHDLIGAVALAEEGEAVGPVPHVRPGLRGDGADLRLGGGHPRAHRQELRLDGDAPFARLEVTGDDRVRRNHASILTAEAVTRRATGEACVRARGRAGGPAGPRTGSTRSRTSSGSRPCSSRRRPSGRAGPCP